MINDICTLLCTDMLVLTALVNKGNVLFHNHDYEKAREFYREALQNDSSCVEALYNFGNVKTVLVSTLCY